MTKSKGLRLLTIAPEILLELIERFAEEPIPEDLKMVGADFNPLRNRFILVMESDKFKHVDVGVFPPFWSPELSWPTPYWEQMRDEIKAALDILHGSTPIIAEGEIPMTEEQTQEHAIKQVLRHLIRAYEGMAVTKPSGDDGGLPEGGEV